MAEDFVVVLISFNFLQYFQIGMEPSDLSPEKPALNESEEDLFKQKYRALKKTLYDVVSDNEYLKSELKYNQKKLLTLEEDKYFLIERLLTHEKPPESPEPPSQEQSDSDQEDASLASSSKRAKMPASSRSSHHPGGVTFSSAFSKVKPLRPMKHKVRKQKTINDFLDSPSTCFASLEDEDSSGFVMEGAGDNLHYHQEEDSD